MVNLPDCSPIPGSDVSNTVSEWAPMVGIHMATPGGMSRGAESGFLLRVASLDPWQLLA
jgi:hypothetical protein